MTTGFLLSVPLAAWCAAVPFFAFFFMTRWRWRIPFGVATLVLACKFFIYRRLYGAPFYPNLTFWPAMGIELFFSALLFAVPLMAAVGLVLLCGGRRGFGAPRSALRRCWALGIVALALALSAKALWEGVCDPQVVAVTVPVKGLPPRFEGFRIAHLTDFHMSNLMLRERLERIVARVNAEKPDLVCLTGDLMDGSPAERLDAMRPFRDLAAPHGVLGCLGNHEVYSGYPAWKRHFPELGIRMLVNESVVLTNGADRLVVGGISEAIMGQGKRYTSRYPNVPVPDLAKTFAKSPAACRILLQHQPVALGKAAAQGVRLQLSGHTHGGIMWFLKSFVGLYYQGHVRGLYREGDIALYVSSGVGQWAGIPIRQGVPSEIAILTLKADGVPSPTGGARP